MYAVMTDPVSAALVAAGVKTIMDLDFGLSDPLPFSPPVRPGDRIAIVASDEPPAYGSVGDWVVMPAMGGGYALTKVNELHAPTRIHFGAVVCTVTVDNAYRIADGTPAPMHYGSPYPSFPGGTIVVYPRLTLYGCGGLSLDALRDQLPLGDFSVTKPPRWGWVLSNPQPPTMGCTCGEDGWEPHVHCRKVTHPGYACCHCGCQAPPPAPIPCKGRQGVFALPDDIATQLGEA